jgi:glycosyltransferase involved in cell wall biosynthesis
MEDKLNYIGLNYHFHREFTNPYDVIHKHSPTDIFLEELTDNVSTTLIKFINGEIRTDRNGIKYYFNRRSNSFWQIPFAAHRFVRKQNPDVIVIQGLIFPLQVLALRFMLGNKPIILLQHQGELPFKRKRMFQRLADGSVNGYLFTSIAIANEWIKAGIIKDAKKCFEIPAAAIQFSKKNKEECKRTTGLSGNLNFLWVGRLTANKDPFTVLAAFEKYAVVNPGVKLYMIYQEDELLTEIKSIINRSNILQNVVKLVGKMQHQELELWYNAADYFILASHREGGSYALMEAMACGCVPVVSKIPASVKMINYGKVGFSFSAGESEDLLRTLISIDHTNYIQYSQNAVQYFKEEMSSAAIGKKMLNIIEQLSSK